MSYSEENLFPISQSIYRQADPLKQLTKQNKKNTKKSIQNKFTVGLNRKES